MVSPSSPEQAPSPQSWKEKIARQWWGLKMLDTEVQIAKDQSRQKLVERLVRKTQDGTLGQLDDGEGEDKEDDDEMATSFQVGDNNTHHHHHPAPAPAPEPKLPGEPSPPKNGLLKKTLLWMLTGGALAAGGYALGDYFATQGTDTDTSLQFSLRPFEPSPEQ
jgi:hypothetical protein